MRLLMVLRINLTGLYECDIFDFAIHSKQNSEPSVVLNVFKYRLSLSFVDFPVISTASLQTFLHLLLCKYLYCF